MTKLSAMPFNDIKFGMFVLPADHDLFGGRGVVTKANKNMLGDAFNHVVIHWDNGNVSMWMHHQYTSVEVDNDQTP